MRTIQSNLRGGINYFGSGTINSKEFIDFSEKFKKSFDREISKIGGTKLKVSVGHFYLSGFFTVKGQILYFSISDVRSHQVTNYKGEVEMLIRTANSYDDFSGGQNRYITIEPNMSKKMINLFDLDTTFKQTKSKVKSVNDLVDLTLSKKELDYYVGSGVKASNIMFKLLKAVNSKQNYVSQMKHGRCITNVSCDCNEFNAYYSGDTKRIRIKLNKG